MILKGYLLSLIYGLFCIAASVIAHKLGLRSIYARKITHILIGFEWVILSQCFGQSIHFVIVCLAFTALVSAIYMFDALPSLSSKGDNSRGTIYYCIAMTLMSAITLLFPEMMIPFGIGVCCTSLGDGFAGIFGQIKRYNRKIYDKKTLFGFLSCFLFSVASVLVINYIYDAKVKILSILCIALFAAILELFAKKGIDNITVTVGAAFLSYLFMSRPEFIMHYILPIIFTLPIVAFVYKKKNLSPAGIIAALILDLMASVAFGNLGFVILMAFFGCSMIADKLKKSSSQKREERTAIQVLANGSLGILFSFIYLIHPSKVWMVAFCAVFAEALADTASSGIGSRSTKTFDVFKWRRVESGVSGGMSLLGTASALISSIFISAVALLSEDIGASEALIVCISGFFGSFIDSLLGSLLQGKFQCIVCGKNTEERIHCNEKTSHISGLPYVNNSVVNFISTVFASIISIALIIFL